MSRATIPPIGTLVHCAETGKAFTIERDGCSFNAAIGPDGAIYSDAGVDARERRALLDRSRPFCAYLSSDGRHLTGWKGNVLGDVVQASESRTGWYGSRLTHVRIVDVHGGTWHGKGAGAGVCIRVRACKT